jgi:hypothetical protein
MHEENETEDPVHEGAGEGAGEGELGELGEVAGVGRLQKISFEAPIEVATLLHTLAATRNAGAYVKGLWWCVLSPDKVCRDPQSSPKQKYSQRIPSQVRSCLTLPMFDRLRSQMRTCLEAT